MSHLRPFVLAFVCLAFTGRGIAWGDPTTQSPPLGKDIIEDPYAPHHTYGTDLRFGTAVGFIYGERLDVLAVGLTAAYGYRFGRLTIEADGAALSLGLKGDSSAHIGSQQQLGALARFDVIRLGPDYVGPNSLFAIYVEGGAAVVWNQWSNPTLLDDAMHVVPANSKRVEGQTGFGIMLDHRLQEPVGLSRIGWFLGWRLGLAPHSADSAVECRGAICRTASPAPESSYTDRSMLFQSSFQFTW